MWTHLDAFRRRYFSCPCIIHSHDSQSSKIHLNRRNSFSHSSYISLIPEWTLLCKATNGSSASPMFRLPPKGGVPLRERVYSKIQTRKSKHSHWEISILIIFVIIVN